jgi:hypothetical protein
MEIVKTDAASAAIGPCCHGITVGNLFFPSGQPPESRWRDRRQRHRHPAPRCSPISRQCLPVSAARAFPVKSGSPETPYLFD